MYFGDRIKTRLADELDMRGKRRKELGGFCLEQLCGSWCYIPRWEKRGVMGQKDSKNIPS